MAKSIPRDRTRPKSSRRRVLSRWKLWGSLRLDENLVQDYLIADATRALKPGQRFELRKAYPTNYGRTFGMAWYHNDAMDKAERWGTSLSSPRSYPGYFLLGQ